MLAPCERLSASISRLSLRACAPCQRLAFSAQRNTGARTEQAAAHGTACVIATQTELAQSQWGVTSKQEKPDKKTKFFATALNVM